VKPSQLRQRYLPHPRAGGVILAAVLIAARDSREYSHAAHNVTVIPAVD